MLNSVKRRIKAYIQATVETLNRDQIQPHIQATVETLSRNSIHPYGDSFWYESPNLWEAPVQLALRDLCRPGATVFDVGANFGGLTGVMSRCAGPRGVVCSFEASPRIFPHLQGNIVKQGYHNVTAYHCAVYSRSNERLRIYSGAHLNDSIYDQGHGGPQAILVNSVALDDFCSTMDIWPSVVKMDIEGAEYDALLGSAGLVEGHHPHLLLEQQPNDTRCLDWLLARGYLALDLNSYAEVRRASDFPGNVGIRNVLFVHSSRTGALPYAYPPAFEGVARIAAESVARSDNCFSTKRSLRLEPGRYLADVGFQATGTQNELMCGVKLDGQVIFRYHGYSKLLADNYRDWVFDVPRGADVELYFEFLNNTFDESFALGDIHMRRLKGFSPSRMQSFAML